MGYFNKKRFTMRQVVGLLTIVFLGIAAIAYAAMTIPHAFHSGDTISSTQMNENFTAVGNQMPGVKVVGPSMWIGPITSAANLQSITVTPPGDGFVIITATGTVIFTHNDGTQDLICLTLSTTSGAIGACGPSSADQAVRSSVPAGFPATGTAGFGMPYSMVKTIPVNAGTATHVYLNGYTSGFSGGANDEAYLFQQTLTAVFVPNALP